MSEHGREIMLSDFAMIVGGLGNLVQPEVQDTKKKCEEYIKAWHLSTEDIKKFIVSHYVSLIFEIAHTAIG